MCVKKTQPNRQPVDIILDQVAGDYGCLYSSWMVLHCLEDSVRDPRADFLVTPSMSAASSPPTTSRTSCWSLK